MGESLQTPPTEIDTDPLPCPTCGYDLRASSADKCSECGQPIDRASLGITSLPWPHRARIGRIRAYCKTVWLITANSSHLKFETLKNQSLPDARSFNRITTFIVALTLSASCAALLAADPHLFITKAHGGISWRNDLLVPWLAALAILPVAPAMLLLLGIHLTSIHRQIFRQKSDSPRMQERAAAIAHYVSAPLAWLLPLTLFAAFNFGLLLAGVADDLGLCFWLTIVAIFFAVMLFPLTLVRIVQWRLRARNQGWEHFLLAGPQMLGLWLLAIFIDLGLLPWCIGLIWIAIDSFR